MKPNSTASKKIPLVFQLSAALALFAPSAFAQLTATVLQAPGANGPIDQLINNQGTLLDAWNLGTPQVVIRNGVPFLGVPVPNPSAANWSVSAAPHVDLSLGGFGSIDPLFFTEVYGGPTVTLTYSNLNPARVYDVQIFHGEPRSFYMATFANNDFLTSGPNIPVPPFVLGNAIPGEVPPNTLDRAIVDAKLTGVTFFTYEMRPGSNRGASIAGFQVRDITSVVTTTADSGAGSLRYAIANSTSGSRITFDPSLAGSTIVLSSGELAVTHQLSIDASGLTGGIKIDGNHASRVFDVTATGNVILNSLTIQNGTDFSGQGGAIANLGSESSLFVTNCNFIGNTAQGGNGATPGTGNNGGPGGGGAGLGGAIYSEGQSLVLSGCSFVTNRAAGGNGGQGNNNGFGTDAGGNGGNPTGGAGGAVGQPGNSGGFGGGGGGGAGSFSQGLPGGSGGFGGGGGAGGATGAGGNGGLGGISGAYGGAGGSAFYSVSGGGGGGAGLGGALFLTTGGATIVNCSFTGNLATNGVGGSGSFGAGDGGNGLGVGGAIYNFNADLTAQNLSFNGNIATSSHADVNTSHEVTTLADSGPGSLRDAVNNSIPGESITFAPNLSGGTIQLTSGELLITNELTIDASSLAGGIKLDGHASSRIFEVDAGTSATLNALSITNGHELAAGGILNNGNLTLNRCTLSGNSALFGGGGICSTGLLAKLVMNNCTVANNTASFAGGIWSRDGAMTLNFCTVCLNSASGGTGGVVVENGTNTINNTMVAANVGTVDADIGGSYAVLNLTGVNFISQPAASYPDETSPGLPNLAGQFIGTAAAPIDPQLSPLGDHGGPTFTMLPLPGSPVIDKIPAVPGVFTDQRGFLRPFGPALDIGAVERGASDNAQVSPSFSLLSASQTITYGTFSIILSGKVSAAGPVYPSTNDTVVAKINGISVTNHFSDAMGDFSFSFPTASIPVSSDSDYVIRYTYAGGSQLFGTSDNSTTLSVVVATPHLTWIDSASILYGTALDESVLNATANVAGNYVYSPPAGTVFDAGTNSVTLVFTPSDTENYSSVTSSVSVAVMPAPLTVTPNNVSRGFGQTNPVFTGSINGLQNGDVITATYACSATLTNAPGNYPIVATLVDADHRLGNYSVSNIPGILTVTTGAQTLAHDDAAPYATNAAGWQPGLNYGYGFLPWDIQTSGNAVHYSSISDNAGSIATKNNSAWQLYAGGTLPPLNGIVASRAFSNSLPIGLSLKLQWRADSQQTNPNVLLGFSLRNGNAGAASSNYTSGERLAIYYHGYGQLGIGQDDLTIRDATGEYYAPGSGIPFSHLADGINVEVTLLSSDTCRIMIFDAETTNLLATYDNIPLAGTGTIDSIALFNSQTGDINPDSPYELFNNLEISTPSVPVLPAVTVTPTNVVVSPGASATFFANASGTPPLLYQWQFNGANLAGQTSSSLSLSNIQVSKAGHYRAVVLSPYGSATSADVNLTVSTPVTILVPPSSTQVSVGGSAQFKVVALSSTAITYQWFFDGAPIAGATNSIYNVLNAQLTDTGTYSVQAANQAGSVATTSAALLVQPSQAPVTPTLTYTVQIQPGMNLIANQLDKGANTLNEILPVVPDGTAVSKFDNASGTWTVNTFSAAFHSWVPSSITLNPGEGAFLLSTSNYSLTFSGAPHTTNIPVNISAGTAYLLSRQTNDIGTYLNTVGTAPVPGAKVFKWNTTNASYTEFDYDVSGWVGGIEPTASVGESMWFAPNGGAPTDIPMAPMITHQPVSVVVAQGSSTSFTVTATGTAPLLYQWQLNGNAIAGATNSEYDITDAEAINVGVYSVVVKNSVGITDSTNATLAISNFGTLPFNDNFANAGDLGASLGGTGTGSNFGATTEPGEDLAPERIVTGATVWLKWQPPSGIASLNTIGSGFDTVLAVYTGTNVANLLAVAADDDSAPNLCSALTFNTTAGTTYYIQVGGFNRKQGGIVFSWNLTPSVDQIPHIVTQPQNTTQTNGGPVLLSVVVTNIGAGVSYQWAFQGVPLPGKTNSTFAIPSLNPSLVGLYTVGITNLQTLLGVVSVPASVEIFNPGTGQPGNFANVGPQDKFLNATALTPHDPNIPNDPTFAGGFTGTQIFSSIGASADSGEPDHCGYPPCHSVWYSYIPPSSGLLTMRTTNNFRAVLSVYSGPGNSFTNLIPVACSASGTKNGETVTFPVTAGSNYWVAIDGINCEFGSYSISYNLAVPAAFTSLPIGRTLAKGGNTVLVASTSGTPPFRYQWMYEGNLISGATNSSLGISNFQDNAQGRYQVMTMNGYGTNVSSAAVVYLNNPPRFTSFGLLQGLASVQFAGVSNKNYIFQVTSNMTTWSSIKTNSSPLGIINFYDPVTNGVGTRFYRAVAQ